MLKNNKCDYCKKVYLLTDLIQITSSDFRPLKKDHFNQHKWKSAIIEGYSTLCENCYLKLCCDENKEYTIFFSQRGATTIFAIDENEARQKFEEGDWTSDENDELGNIHIDNIEEVK